MGIALFHFINWSPINGLYLFPSDSGKDLTMSKATSQNGWLGVTTTFDSILCKNLITHEHFFSSGASKIVLEPDQMS